MSPRPRRVGRNPTVLAALCVLGLAASCGEEPQTPDVQYTVHGIVRDAASGDRLKGVRVAFRSDTLDEAAGSTDGKGEYAFAVETDAKNGRLEASKGGYQKRVVSIYFDANDVQVDIELNAN